MVKKNAVRISAVVLAMAMMSPAAMMNAHAVGIKYTPVQGTETSFDKYLVLEKDATVPNATFNFTIANGDDIPATADHFAVLAPTNKNGVTGSPSIEADQAKFAPGDSTTDEEAKLTDETVNFVTTSKAANDDLGFDEKYAKHKVKIDFSKVTFSEPGVYRYKITENAMTSIAGLTTDKSTKYLDVYVTDNDTAANTGTLKVSGYVLHDKADAPKSGPDKGTADVAKDNDRLGTKSTGFTNKLITDNLSIAKQVNGNQGSKDQYFAFTVKLDPAANTQINDEDIFKVDAARHADSIPTANSATAYTAADMKAANNIAELTGAQLKAGYTFYLKNGQYVTIYGIGRGTTYTVTEDAKDYKSTAADKVMNGTTVKGVTADDETFTDATTAAISKDTKTGYLNTKDGVIPTGLVSNHLVAFGSLAAMVCAAFAAMFLFKKNKKDERPAA